MLSAFVTPAFLELSLMAALCGTVGRQEAQTQHSRRLLSPTTYANSKAASVVCAVDDSTLILVEVTVRWRQSVAVYSESPDIRLLGSSPARLQCTTKEKFVSLAASRLSCHQNGNKNIPSSLA